MSPTPEMIALARRVAASIYRKIAGAGDYAKLIANGEADHDEAVRAALAMALEITERAARMAETVPVTVPLAPGLPDGASIARRTIATALRSFEHVEKEG